MTINKKVGTRVTISTHGSNLGTIEKIDGDFIVVQMDGEPGPRFCRKENVFPYTLKLFKFKNTEPLGSVPEYCVKVSVISRNEEFAREFLSKEFDDIRFLDKSICVLDEEFDCSLENQLIDWESDS